LKQLNRLRGFSLFFGLIRFALAQLVSSPPFRFPSAASLLADAVTSLHRVMLPVHWTKISLLSPLHLPPMHASLHHLPFRGENEALNLHHHSWPPSPDHPTPTLHCYKIISTVTTFPTHSIVFSFCLLPNQSTTPLELHPPPSFYFTVVPRSSSIHIMTHTLMN
jgi:hypothetical protein